MPRSTTLPGALVLLLCAGSAAAQWAGAPAKCSASTATGAQLTCGTLDACVTVGGCTPKFVSVRGARQSK